MVGDASWVPVLIAVGLGLGFLSVLMLVLCYWYRRRRQQRQDLKQQVVEQYRPLLFDWIAGSTPSLDPPDSDLEWVALISLWNDLHDKVGSSEHQKLRKAAVELGIQGKARKLLNHRSVEQQITGIITLGHLEDDGRIERIKQLSKSSTTILKLQSIKALSELDPELALNKVYDDLIDAPNQSSNYYLGFCRSIDSDIVTSVTLDRLDEITPQDKPRVIPFLELARQNPASQYIRRELEHTQRPEVISACLKILGKIGEPTDEALVQTFLDHKADFVRIQAAKSLGLVGTSESVEPLTNVLDDSNWWVRCRAAQSLMQLPSTGLEDIRNLIPHLDEPRAQKALRSAISEVETV